MPPETDISRAACVHATVSEMQPPACENKKKEMYNDSDMWNAMKRWL